MQRTGMKLAGLATVVVAMLVVLVAGLNASATLVVLFFAAVLGGLAGGRLAWIRSA